MNYNGVAPFTHFLYNGKVRTVLITKNNKDDKIEPIELTFDLLQKIIPKEGNRFEKDGDVFQVRWSVDEEYTAVVERWGDLCVAEILQNDKSIARLPCKYLHQLETLFYIVLERELITDISVLNDCEYDYDDEH